MTMNLKEKMDTINKKRKLLSGPCCDGTLICNQDKNHECDNLDMKKCAKCGPMLCFCTRSEVCILRKKAWMLTEAVTK